MFKFVLATVLIFSIASAKPQNGITPSKDAGATIVANSTQNDGSGSFVFSFETSNGIKVEDKGILKKVKSENGTELDAVVQEGSYSYIGDDGKTYEIKWTADENGKFFDYLSINFSNYKLYII